MLSFVFCFLLIDDDDPKRDAVAVPLLDTLTITKAPSQEDAMVVKSPEAPAKKGTPARASKRLKKVVAVGTSLEVQPVASFEDVSIASCSRLFHCLNLSSHAFVWQNLMRKFLSLGTECVEIIIDYKKQVLWHLEEVNTWSCLRGVFLVIISPLFVICAIS
jgi:hypothetical protein